MKDIYYYDDTHWAPLAVEKIAQDIFENMKSDQ